MGDIATMLVALGINTGPFTAGLAEAQGKLTGFAGAAESTGSRATKALGGMGLAVAGGVALIGAAAVDMASKFQGSLTTIEVAAHLPATAIAGIGTAITQAAIGTTTSADTMAAALGPVAGELEKVTGHVLTAADASSALAASQHLAEASGTDFTTSLKSITDLMLVYHQPLSAAASDTDLLAAAHEKMGFHAGWGIATDQLAALAATL